MYFMNLAFELNKKLLCPFCDQVVNDKPRYYSRCICRLTAIHVAHEKIKLALFTVHADLEVVIRYVDTDQAVMRYEAYVPLYCPEQPDVPIIMPPFDPLSVSKEELIVMANKTIKLLSVL